ncbi:MAG: DUF47 family protein [Pseudomonadota bacterium]|nr:DUF47 family protein [Pseudomonadota bacterium]
MKTRILAALGESGLQQATALNAGLAANDRVEYFFALLQMAVEHALNPKHPAISLTRERLTVGVDDADLDQAVAGARAVGKECRIPGAAWIMQLIASDMRLMAAPVAAAHETSFGDRLETLLAACPQVTDDLVDPNAISAMTRAAPGMDSLKSLVMDLHTRLDALQAIMAQETLDGAAVYGLDEADRPMVAAFMAGVNRTSRLKFNHPGLATTATRTGGRLVIQNDIGMTDAHVIVVHVQDRLVSVTYTDVHAERLAFFQSMLKPRSFVWEAGRTAVLGVGTPFYLVTGQVHGEDDASCHADLEFLGSRLVFLIDWNRARKQLRSFQRGADRVALLSWAAETETGHRGFLELGGARLVNRAIEATAVSAMRFGDRLCDVLGDAETATFLQFAFRAATEGLLASQSHALIQDRVRVALAAQFSTEERQLLGRAAEHATLLLELASLVRDGAQDDATHRTKRARQARRFEHEADQIVGDIRDAVRRRPDYQVFLPMLEAADEAADALEDAAFLLDLEPLTGKTLRVLQTLADLLVTASQEWVKAVGHAGQIGDAKGVAGTEDFLTAIARIAALEHEADDAERSLAASAVQHAGDFRQLHLFAAIGKKLEAAADALTHASLILREQVLEHVIDG